MLCSDMVEGADAASVQRRAAEETHAFSYRRHISSDEASRTGSFEDLSLSEGRVEQPSQVRSMEHQLLQQHEGKID